MAFVYWYRFWPFVLILTAIAVVFGGSVTGAFLSWDDSQHIVNNPWLTVGEASRFWRGEYDGFYIPVTYTAWTLMYKLWPSPIAFHLFNIFWHLINSCLVYVLGRKLLASRTSEAVELGERGRQTFALIAALIFALHPLQVESVAWISGGREVLAGFFALSAMLMAWNSADRLFPSWAAILRRIGATLFFALGLLCKPTLAILPIAIKWLSWFTERRGLKWPMMWVWLAMGGVVAGLTIEIQSSFVHEQAIKVSDWDRLRVSLDSLVFYFYKVVDFQTLSADYGRTPALIPSWPILIGVATLIAGLWFILPRAVWGGLGFFILMLAPTLGVVGFSAEAQSTVFDRYTYLPLVGLALIFATLMGESKTRLELRILGAFTLIGYMGWTSFKRVPVWHSDATLFSDVVTKNPTSYVAWVNLGTAALEANDLPNARQYFVTAQNLNPRLAIAFANLAQIAWLEKRTDEVLDLAESLTNPTFQEFNRQEDAAMALLYRMQGRVLWERGDAVNARLSYCEAVLRNAVDPNLLDEVESFFKEYKDLEHCPQ